MVAGTCIALAALALTACLEVPPSRLGGGPRDGGSDATGAIDGGQAGGCFDAAPDPGMCPTELDLPFDCAADLHGWKTSFDPGCSIGVSIPESALRFAQSTPGALCRLYRDGFDLRGRALSAKLRDADGNLSVSVGIGLTSGPHLAINRDDGVLHLASCTPEGLCTPDAFGSADVTASGPLWVRLVHDSASSAVSFEQSEDGIAFTAIAGTKAIGVTDADMNCATIEVGVAEIAGTGTTAAFDRIRIGPP